jgi:hypothetical protein
MTRPSYADEQRSRELVAPEYRQMLAALEALPESTDPHVRDAVAKAKQRCEFMLKPWTCENGYHDDAPLGSNFGKDRSDVGMPGMQGTVYYFGCRLCGRRSYSGRFA